MRAVAITMVAGALLAGSAQAQDKPRPEIGIRGGFAHYKAAGESFSVLVTPGSQLASPAVIHLTYFATPRIALEPQLGFIRSSGAGTTVSVLSLGGQVMGFLREADHSPYAFVLAGMDRQTGIVDDNQYGVGAGIGYRTILREALAVRLEGRFRRITDDGSHVDEIAALVGFGAVMGKGEAAPGSDRAIEVGFRSGVTRFSFPGSDLKFTTVSVPEGAISPAMVHATFIVAPHLAVEPQLSFARYGDSDGTSQSVVALGGQVMGLLQSPEHSPYGFLYGDLIHANNDGGTGSDGDTRHSLGGGLGYRMVVHRSLALRLEGRYRKIYDDGDNVNEVGLFVGIGAMIGR
ncbi:MAG: hypothetical protein ABIS27_07420 [Longimicrobiales bacterium]